MCVWLGTLATYRPGFVCELVLRYCRRLAAQAPADVVEFAARRKAGHANACGRSRRSRSTRRVRRGAVHRRPPRGPAHACGSAERRPPGESWSPGARLSTQTSCATWAIAACLFVRGGADGRRSARCPPWSTRRWWPSSARARPRRTAKRWRGISRRPRTHRRHRRQRNGTGHRRRLSARQRPPGGAVGARPGPRATAVPSVLAGVLGAGVRLAVPLITASMRDIEHRGLLVAESGWGLAARVVAVPGSQPRDRRTRRAVVLVEGAARAGRCTPRPMGSTSGETCWACPARRGGPVSRTPSVAAGRSRGVRVARRRAGSSAVASAAGGSAGIAGADGGCAAICRTARRRTRVCHAAPGRASARSVACLAPCGAASTRPTSSSSRWRSTNRPWRRRCRRLELDGLLDVQAGRYRLRRETRRAGAR